MIYLIKSFYYKLIAALLNLLLKKMSKILLQNKYLLVGNLNCQCLNLILNILKVKIIHLLITLPMNSCREKTTPPSRGGRGRGYGRVLGRGSNNMLPQSEVNIKYSSNRGLDYN